MAKARMLRSVELRFEATPDGRLPWGVRVDESPVARGAGTLPDGLTPAGLAHLLIGLHPEKKCEVTTWAYEMFDDPDVAVGQYATFSDGGFFLVALKITEVRRLAGY